MNSYYIYLLLILLMFILIYNGIDCSLRFSPIKIKFLGTVMLSLIGLRYIVLLILLTIKNIRYLYLLKPLIFLNLLSVPILAFLSLYILARNDKIRFNYAFIILGVLFLGYIIMSVFIPTNISSLGSLGYNITLDNWKSVYGVYLIINTVLFLYSIISLEQRGVNKLGIILILFSSIAAIIEIIMRAFGISVFPDLVIGDLFWIVTANFAVYRFKK